MNDKELKARIRKRLEEKRDNGELYDFDEMVQGIVLQTLEIWEDKKMPQLIKDQSLEEMSANFEDEYIEMVKSESVGLAMHSNQQAVREIQKKLDDTDMWIRAACAGLNMNPYYRGLGTDLLGEYEEWLEEQELEGESD